MERKIYCRHLILMDLIRAKNLMSEAFMICSLEIALL